MQNGLMEVERFDPLYSSNDFIYQHRSILNTDLPRAERDQFSWGANPHHYQFYTEKSTQYIEKKHVEKNKENHGIKTMGLKPWSQNHRCKLVDPTYKFTFK